MVTSSGIAPSLMISRTKSKSVWLADGNPTSISLYPMLTSRSNIRRLRAGLIGSISAWLPSRRSTAHHKGALPMTRSGQMRSASLIGSTSSANGRYRLTGIDEPRCGFHAGWSERGGPAGLVTVRALKDDEVYASGWADSEKLVTIIAPGMSEGDFRPAHREPPRRE